MDQSMQKIANTVVANLANTSEVGLFKGKMGLTLFMYEYAKKKSINNAYEATADMLIDDIYKQIKPNIATNLIDGSAGIGFGLSYLLKNGLIDGEPNNVLEDIDKRLLENPKNVLLTEMTLPIPVFSSGFYFLARSSFCNEEQKSRWINLLSDAAIYFVLSIVKKQHFEPRLSLLNSMLFIFNQISKECNAEENSNIVQLIHNLTMLIISAIKKGLFAKIDILLLKEITHTLPKMLYEEYDSYLTSLLSSIDVSTIEVEELNNELWWYFIYEIEVLPSYSKEILKKHIEQKLLDYSYDIDIINSQFSILGLSLIKYSTNL